MTVVCPAKVDNLFRARTKTHYGISFYGCAIAADFPSPADEYLEGKLDLNQYLIPHPLATYFVRVTRKSMLGAGIYPGDLLIVDRSLEPKENRVVTAPQN